MHVHVHVHVHVWFFRNGQKFVDEAVGRIRELSDSGELTESNQYGFLTYLLGKPELTYKDLSIITLSLFADGLSTVRYYACSI